MEISPEDLISRGVPAEEAEEVHERIADVLVEETPLARWRRAVAEVLRPEHGPRAGPFLASACRMALFPRICKNFVSFAFWVAPGEPVV